MKKLLFVLSLILVLSHISNAQEQIQTLIKGSSIHQVGLYLEPEAHLASIDNKFTPFSGASAMMIFNHRLAIGVMMQRLLDDKFSPKSISPLILRSHIIGAKVEYTFMPRSVVHLTIPLIIGIGRARADSLQDFPNIFFHERHFRNGNTRSQAKYAIIEPGLQVEANLHKFVKIYAGAHYRIAPNVETNAVITKDILQGATFNAGVKVGLFSIPKCGTNGRLFSKSVPEPVLLGFQNKFATTTDLHWDKERNGEWEANFKQDKLRKSANFSAEGAWLETESEVMKSDVPTALQQTISSSKRIKACQKIVKADGTVFYEVEMRRKEMLFDKDGILINK